MAKLCNSSQRNLIRCCGWNTGTIGTILEVGVNKQHRIFDGVIYDAWNPEAALKQFFHEGWTKAVCECIIFSILVEIGLLKPVTGCGWSNVSVRCSSW